MSEDEAAADNLIAAIERVHKMPWPSIREKILWRALKIIAHLLGLQIVKIDEPDAPSSIDPSNQPKG